MNDQPATSSKPTTLDEAHLNLLGILLPEQIEELKSHPENLARHHHGLGTFIRNEWIRHGKLSRTFLSIGPMSVDAMSSLIMEAFVAKLRGELFDLEGRAAEMSAVEREYRLSITPSDAGSPTSR